MRVRKLLGGVAASLLVLVAGLAALIAPSSGGDDGRCAPLLKQIQEKG